MTDYTSETGVIKLEYSESNRGAAPVRRGCGLSPDDCGFFRLERKRVDKVEFIIGVCMMTTQTRWRQSGTVCGVKPSPQENQ